MARRRLAQPSPPGIAAPPMGSACCMAVTITGAATFNESDVPRPFRRLLLRRMTNYWQPILVEHTIMQAGLQSLELLILRLGTDAKPDAFILRNAELRLTSD